MSVRVERDGAVATLFVDRPDKLNALDAATISALHQQVTALDADDGVGAVIVTGSGDKAFVAGADISELADQGVLDGAVRARVGQQLTLAMESSRKPFIAAINGFALGGGLELALGCDVRYASSKAKLGLPEVSLGIIPGYGGTQRLPRLIGSGMALEMILTGDHINAEVALRIGLVNGVCEPDKLRAHCEEIARKMVSRGPTALALAKQAVRRGAGMRLEEGLDLEADLFGMISSTDETKEGLRAFLEKRKPGWLRG